MALQREINVFLWSRKVPDQHTHTLEGLECVWSKQMKAGALLLPTGSGSTRRQLLLLINAFHPVHSCLSAATCRLLQALLLG